MGMNVTLAAAVNGLVESVTHLRSVVNTSAAMDEVVQLLKGHNLHGSDLEIAGTVILKAADADFDYEDVAALYNGVAGALDES